MRREPSISKPVQSIEIFCSYAHADEVLQKELEKHLSNLRRQGLISMWHNRNIDAGTDWANQIEKHLNSAQIILLLVSPDFMASDYCYSIEMKRALERHEAGEALVIPIILRPCDWRGIAINRLQALPKEAKPVTRWTDRDEAFLNIIEGIRASIEIIITKFDFQYVYPATYHNIKEIPPSTNTRTIQQRETVVKEIYARLTQTDATTLVLTGIGGVGKTILAALIYHYAQKQYSSGKGPFLAEPLWLTINTADNVTDLVGTLFEAFNKPLPNMDHLTPQKLAMEFFNILNTSHQMRLVVLDQFENLLDVQTGKALVNRPGIDEWIDVINSLPCYSRMLLTSRQWPIGTHDYPPMYMQEYEVKGLEVAEGIALLRKQGVEIEQATEIELRDAVNRCGGHGLALRLLASILRRNRGLSLTSFFNRTDYTQFWVGNIARNLLDYVYMHQLDSMQRKTLIGFSIYREAISLDAALKIANTIPKDQILSTLEVLISLHLLQAIDEDRYQLHSLVADYAHRHFDDTSEEANKQSIQEAHSMAAQYYLYQVARHFTSKGQRQNIEDVRPLIEATWHLCQAEQWKDAYQLMERENIYKKLKRWGSNVILLDLYQQLLPLDKWHPDAVQIADIYASLGKVCDELGQKKRALEYLDQAISNYRKARKAEQIGTTLSNLGSIYSSLGQEKEARLCYKEALSVFEEIKYNHSERGTLLNKLGQVYSALGQRIEARQCYEDALQIFKEVGDRSNEGTTLLNLGQIYEDLELYDDQWFERPAAVSEQSLKYYKEALQIFKEIDDQREEGLVFNGLATVYRTLGKRDKALQNYQGALAIFRQIGDQWEEGKVLNDLGLIYSESGDKTKALNCYDKALYIRREIRDLSGEGKTLLSIGGLYFGQERYDIALACFLLAKGIFEKLQISSAHNETQALIDALNKMVGKERFFMLLDQIESKYHFIIDQELSHKR